MVARMQCIGQKISSNLSVIAVTAVVLVAAASLLLIKGMFSIPALALCCAVTVLGASLYVYFKNYFSRAAEQEKPTIPRTTEFTEKPEPKPRAEQAAVPLTPHLHILSQLSSSHDIIDHFNRCWDSAQGKYLNKNGLSIDISAEVLQARIVAHNTLFTPTLNLDNAYGFIEKKDFVQKTKICVTADLHADLRTLLKFLKDWKDQGLLDENYKCKDNVQMVFLGDYSDRGAYSMQVLELLLALRMEDPEHVTLIRGNHEYSTVNRMFASIEDYAFQSFLANSAYRQHLDALYETMPLTMYMSDKSQEGVRQYMQFTHGLFELYVDPAEMLDSDTMTQMVVSKEKTLSTRVQGIEVDLNADYAKLLASATEKAQRTKLKQQLAAQKIQKLLLTDTFTRIALVELTAYNWGDMTRGFDSYLGNMGQRQWTLSVEDVKHYLRLCGGEKSKVKMVMKGHKHEKEHCQLNGKIVVTTLPVAMETQGYQSQFEGQESAAYILRTAAKVKDWEKIPCRSHPGETETYHLPAIPVIMQTVDSRHPPR